MYHCCHHRLQSAEGRIKVDISKPNDDVNVAGDEHEHEARENEAESRCKPSPSSACQAPEKHAEFSGFRPRKDLIHGEDAIETRHCYPLLFDYQAFFDDCDLSYGTPPGKDTEFREEKPEDAEY